MEEPVYDIGLDWLVRWAEVGGLASNATKSVKWLKIEEIEEEDMEAGGFRMMVLTGGKGYKSWIEVRRTESKAGYGLFAAVRFERGDIITALVPGEEEAKEARLPSKSNLKLGGSWAVRRSQEELGKSSNAIYVPNNGLIRAKNRILPGSEILLDAEMQAVFGFEYLDCLVFSEPRQGWRNWQSKTCIGTIKSGDLVNGFIAEFDQGRKKVRMSQEEVRRLAVYCEISEPEKIWRGGKRARSEVLKTMFGGTTENV